MGLTDSHEEERDPIRRRIADHRHLVHRHLRPRIDHTTARTRRHPINHRHVPIPIILLRLRQRIKRRLRFSHLTPLRPPETPPTPTIRIRIVRTTIGITIRRPTERKTVLNECDAETGAGTESGGVGCVEEIGEEETYELERDGDEHVPEEREEGACGESVDDHLAESTGG